MPSLYICVAISWPLAGSWNEPAKAEVILKKCVSGCHSAAVHESGLDLESPDTGSRLRLRLDSPQLSRKGAPSDATFRFDPPRAGVSKVIQLDEACGP